MLSFNPEKKNCTGCAACYSVCPKQCISMIRDEEGFCYPELTSPDICVNCKLCENVCQINKSNVYVEIEQKAFAAVSRDYSIWKRSASGGAFSEICRAWGDENTLIVGAAWDGFYVHHVGIIGVGNIQPLCKSKYVSSHIEESFKEIRSYLKKGKVIFCGTPCQVDGLRSFLHKDYENLMTIDFICHGVGSPAVFEACIRAINKQFGKELVSYSFRAKRNVYEADYLTSLKFLDSTVYMTNDPYIQLFLKQTCLRPSCGSNCNYRGRLKRPGDFTIADFKGMTKVFPDLIGSKRNYSTIVANSRKSLAVLPMLQKQMDMRTILIDDIIKYNPLFDRHTWQSVNRDVFFAEFIKDEDATIQRYTKPCKPLKTSFRGKLYNILPVWLRKLYLITFKMK